MTRLLINGEDYCEVYEISVEEPGRHRLLLEKPVEVDLLESRRFEVRLPEGQVVGFDVVFDDEGDPRPSVVGCPRPEGFIDSAR